MVPLAILTRLPISLPLVPNVNHDFFTKTRKRKTINHKKYTVAFDFNVQTASYRIDQDLPA